MIRVRTDARAEMAGRLTALAVMVVGPSLLFAADDRPGPASARFRDPPRFLVPDFTPMDDEDESSWVALAVSESLRPRLRRTGASSAVSGMRTAAVMTRLTEAEVPKPETVVHIARMAGADWAVIGGVGLTKEGTYVATVSLRKTKDGSEPEPQRVEAGSLRPLIDRVTDAVLARVGIRLTDEQLAELRKIPRGSDSALEYYAKATRAVRQSKPNDALFYVAQSRRYDPEFRPTMKLLGQINLAVGNRREVLMIYQRLLRQAKIDGDLLDEIYGLTQIAITHQRNGKHGIADKYYASAIEKARALDSRDMLAILYGALATLRVDQRKSDQALELIQRRLQLLQAQGDRLALGPAHISIALIHAARKEREDAIRYLRQAVKLSEEVGNQADKAAALFQIGAINKEGGNIDAAIQAFNESIGVTEHREAGSAYRELAEIYEEQGKLDKALAMLQKAEEILAARKSYAQQANCLARIARLYDKRGEGEEAVDTMSLAVEMLRDLNHPQLARYQKELAELKSKEKR